MDENEKERLQEILGNTVRELEEAKLLPGEYEEISKKREMHSCMAELILSQTWFS